MNSFTNAILSLLLSWIRVIINQFWKLLSSETGERIISFIANNWLMLLIILCGVGFVIDLIVFFFRWRPDIVWKNRRRKKEAELEGDYSQEMPSAPHTPSVWSYGEDYTNEATMRRGSYSVDYTTAGYKPVRPSYMESAPPQPSPAEVTAVYAPPNTVQPSVPVDFDPVFDEDDALRWDEPLPQTPRTADRSKEYMLDVMAGFAPQPSAEQLFAPKVPGPDPINAPVHPGLDTDSLRKNIGLSPAGSLQSKEPEEEPVVAINTNPVTEQPLSPLSRNPLAKLAQLMGADENKRSIYDLQPQVDFRDAFHEPVYPIPRFKEDDPTSNY